MDFIAVHFPVTDAQTADLLTGQLTLLGFTGFQEEPGRFTACLPRQDLEKVEAAMAGLAKTLHLTYEIQPIPWQNWNEQWERSFSPVLIGSFCGIRAAFHAPVRDVTHEIIITPKMTFGTGHHATTASMIRLIETLALSGRSVFDFGTGTGILAILAAKMGAAPITAVDNDPAAVENARENARENKVAERITCYTADRAEQVPGVYDCILANIQLTVITENLPALAGRINPGGMLVTSGVLEADAGRLEKAAKKSGLVTQQQIRESGWTATLFTKY